MASSTLPITLYPDIAPPTVQVSAFYQGANADVVMKSVIVPLEEQINGVENMTYMTSSAGNDGSAGITIYFKQGTNPDLAAVNVQNRVSRAVPLLPAEVTRAGVTTSKQQSSMVMVFAFKQHQQIVRRGIFAELCQHKHCTGNKKSKWRG